MKGFSSKVELRIDWSEVDLFGHVNNLAILKYIQAARVQYLEALGLMQSQSETGVGPILASTTCHFRKPLFYPGNVTVRSRVDEIKNTSFRLQHSVYNENDEIAAEAQEIIVVYDFSGNTKMLIPAAVRARILDLENAADPVAPLARVQNATTVSGPDYRR